MPVVCSLNWVFVLVTERNYMLAVPLACIAALQSHNAPVVHSVYTHLLACNFAADMELHVTFIYTKSFNWKSLSACNEDKTFTVQCIFVAKNGLLTLAPYPFKTYIFCDVS